MRSEITQTSAITIPAFFVIGIGFGYILTLPAQCRTLLVELGPGVLLACVVGALTYSIGKKYAKSTRELVAAVCLICLGTMHAYFLLWLCYSLVTQPWVSF